LNHNKNTKSTNNAISGRYKNPLGPITHLKALVNFNNCKYFGSFGKFGVHVRKILIKSKKLKKLRGCTNNFNEASLFLIHAFIVY